MKNIFLLYVLFLLAPGCKTTQPSSPPAQKKKPHSAKIQPRKKQIFIVIDDAGLSMQQARQFLEIPIPMTIAVMPQRKYSREVARLIAKDPKKEIILHQPMEAYNAKANPGAGALFCSMQPSEVPSILNKNLQTVPNAVGMNNHMGSRLTEKTTLMNATLSYCRDHHLFFLDSKTAYNSQVPRVAAQLHMHMEQRDVFLDIKHDRGSIEKMWNQTIQKAQQNGYVIAIGHAWSAETAATIRNSFKTLQKKGYTFHRLSELYNQTP
jgi:polysaccharide deacetylase 2 family uncharacterized protein YibQ